MTLPRAMRPATAPDSATWPGHALPLAGPGGRAIAFADLHDGPLPDEGAGRIVAALRAAGHRVQVAKAGAHPGSALARLKQLLRAGRGEAPVTPADLLIISAPPVREADVARLAARAAVMGIPVLLDRSRGEGPQDLAGLFATLGPGGLEVQAQVGKVSGMRLAAHGTGEGLLALCHTAQMAVTGEAEHIPDYADFDWPGAPVIPVRAGMRSIEALMCEMLEQARRHEVTQFLFRDPALNARPECLREIASHLPAWLPGAEWAAEVAIDTRRRNGLSRAELRAALAGGLRRVAVTIPDLDHAAVDLQQAAADMLTQGAEAGLLIHARVAGDAGPVTLGLAGAGRLHRLRALGEPSPAVAALMAQVNARPESRAGLAFARVL